MPFFCYRKSHRGYTEFGDPSLSLGMTWPIWDKKEEVAIRGKI
jgi:hypothetical protein